ncbi:uncharacterized protein LOC110381583 [Helicoverpa armigera]|uniref:uncharacterized protein LOC110381583 n=1 Tax=Helicoverpa armigera TaxID=29058 RepID=UPI003082BE76
MDLKEIIKWFIPCFHILLLKKVKMFGRLTYIVLFLLFIWRPGCGANANLVSDSIDTKNVVSSYLDSKYNQSDVYDVKMDRNDGRSLDLSTGRTFGRPLKKMMQALIPLAFQIGAASTWAVVAAIVGIKTLLVALVILKLLLMAGAAKVGALFGQKTHHGHGWEAPAQKEIHLHIHNGAHPEIHDEHGAISAWNRDSTGTAAASDKNINLVINPYAAVAGPQTISTPYGNYVRVDSPSALSSLSSLSSLST